MLRNGSARGKGQIPSFPRDSCSPSAARKEKSCSKSYLLFVCSSSDKHAVTWGEHTLPPQAGEQAREVACSNTGEEIPAPWAIEKPVCSFAELCTEMKGLGVAALRFLWEITSRIFLISSPFLFVLWLRCKGAACSRTRLAAVPSTQNSLKRFPALFSLHTHPPPTPPLALIRKTVLKILWPGDGCEGAQWFANWIIEIHDQKAHWSYK